jgi:ATP-binding cassette, subfamily B, bacterial CvaB/MchF/RaxB
MQDDQLLSGSVADNICFFDPDYNQEKLLQCTRLAGIHDEKQPRRRYGQFAFSGPEAAGASCAGAVYREPRILFLDEGTAHLDVDNERLINQSLRALRMTRISVAHRPDMASGADRIVRVFRTVQSGIAGPPLLPDALDKNTPGGRLPAPA